MYIVEFVNRQGYNPCGSDYTRIIRDLKTVRGVMKRIENGVKPHEMVEANIYLTGNVFDRDSYTLVATVEI